MNWTEKQITAIIQDLSEDNPFACRALFKVAEILFTDEVPTLAVSLSSRPALMINKGFLDNHAWSEYDVKALLLHEFLHIILLHTEKFSKSTPLLNIALDAIINSIIHRTCGEKYSGFFTRFYKWEGIEGLLRRKPDNEDDLDEWWEIHQKIYSGKFAADDLYELLKYLAGKGRNPGIKTLAFIGNHGFGKKAVSPVNKELLDEILGKMDGTGIWNDPAGRGIGDVPDHDGIALERLKARRWRGSAAAILRKCMMEDQRLHRSPEESHVMMPLLSPGDRRALSSFSWSGIIPMAANRSAKYAVSESVNIYLDVSGSMEHEIRQLTALLHSFRSRIRMPLWAFSNEVSRAAFRDGRLVYGTTSGTSISCVFDHIRKMKFRRNLIVTDGYIETIDKDMLRGVDTGKLWVILSANGCPAEFHNNGIKYFQLEKF